MSDSLGPYELIRLLGKGGMGEVHLARDTRLHREVALKLLPPELADDPERRARFLREARAAAGLTHPNITTILDVGEDGGRDYIAQEYLEGRPLSDIVAERRLLLTEIVQWALPLAEALAYAHERGVIHRDLKPANIIITDQGHPKLLDFGLAKMLHEGSGHPDDQSTTLTLSGAVFGTPSAMSPEQALGKSVDARSDVFAFGALLYEMATGKPAFLGTTVQETLDKVLHAEPEPLERERRDLPGDFAAIVEKALRKDADARYPSMGDLAADLRHFKRRTDSGVVPPASGAATKEASLAARLAPAALAVALTGMAVWAASTWFMSGDGGSTGTASRPLPRLSNPRQLTSLAGAEAAGSLSRSGDLLAYHARPGTGGDAQYDIWITQVGGGAPVNRTQDVDDSCLFPSLSPDGRTIAFFRASDLGMRRRLGLYVTPSLGGPARLLVPRIASAGPPQWSRDGERMAFCEAQQGRSIIRIVDWTGTTTQEIPIPDSHERLRFDLAWSPDERLFAFIEAPANDADNSRLWAMPADGGEAVPLTDGTSRVTSPNWSPDGGALYYVSNRGGTMDMWMQPMTGGGKPDGSPSVLTAGVGMRDLHVARDGRQLVYGRGGAVVNLWRVPIYSDDLATWRDSLQVTFDDAYIEYSDVSPDGSWLAIGTDRSGIDNLWVLPSEGGEWLQLTDQPKSDWAPRISPDGEQIVFYSLRSGNRDIWIMPSEGGAARQLTTGPGTEWFPNWSPDGTRIKYSHNWYDDPQLFTMNADGSEQRRVVPDDSEVLFNVYTAFVDQDSFITVKDERFVILGMDGALERRFDVPIGSPFSFRVLPDRKQLVFLYEGDAWRLDLESGEAAQLTALSGRPGWFSTIQAAGEEFMWIGWREDRGDLWMMDVEQ